MAKTNGCDKSENIAEVSASGSGAVVSDKTPANSSAQSEKSLMPALDSAVNAFTGAVEEVARAIDAGTRQIDAIDCSDMLFEFIKENVPMFGKANSFLNAGTNFMKGISTGTTISKLIQEPEFMKSICGFIENWGGMIDGWLDIIVKASFALFNKIDAARERLENATLDFTEAVRNCILDVFNAIREKLFKTINLSLSINWDSLLNHMNDCPCLCVVIANLLGCTEDDAGNDITRNPAAVKACIEEKYKLLTPVGLSVALDNLLTKYVRQYIDMVFNYLESWIVYIFNLVIKPFRWLLKKYVEMLRKKIDVTAFIKGLGPFECFFVYTTEYENGKEFLGMSAIDMINTYRGWYGCLQLVCPGLSEKIKNRVKELYKDLRLDDKYWRRAMEMDVYTCCLAVDLDGLSTRESVLRELYSESPWDVLMSLFRKNKNKGDDVSADEEEFDEYETSRPVTAADMMPTDSNSKPSAISDAINFTYAPETENSVNVGTRKISTDDEEILKTIGDSMVAGSKYDSMYVERFYQLIRFGNGYATSRAYVEHMERNLGDIERPGSQYDSNIDCFMGDSTSNRVPDFSDNPTGLPTVGVIGPDGATDSDTDVPHVEVNYYIPSDFDKERSDKISGFRFTERGKDESLESYYRRMFNMAQA